MSQTAVITQISCTAESAAGAPALRALQLSPVFGLSLFLVFAAGTALLTQIQNAAATLLVAALFWLLPRENRTPLRQSAKLFLSVNAFVAFLWLVTPWTTPGNAVVRYGSLAVTDRGLILAALVTLKCNAALVAFLALLAGERTSQTVGAMRALGLPQKLCVLTLLMVRNIACLKRELTSLKEAAQLRAFSARCNAHSYRTLAAFASLIFIRAFFKSRKLEETLALRGFANVWPIVTVPALASAERACVMLFSLAVFALFLCDAGLLPCPL